MGSSKSAGGSDFYRPAVLASRTIEKSGTGDRFSLLLMNKTVLAKAALDVDCQSTYFPAGAGRSYSVTFAPRIQQIEGYGSATEHKLPPNQGNGYIWRMYSITRFEERDGGVYFEVEAITLSRDIPFAFRWLVEPMVRRFSKNTLVTSLRQTQKAVATAVAANARLLGSTDLKLHVRARKELLEEDVWQFVV